MDDTVSFRLWPPAAIGLPLVFGAALTWVAGDPVDLPDGRIPAGWALVGFFAVWNGWCLLLFRRHRTGLLPGQPTTSMLEHGPYRWSRNPLYLGMLVLYVGLALLLPTLWGLLITPLAVVMVDWGAIRQEERFLHEKFGVVYDAYAARLRRWV